MTIHGSKGLESPVVFIADASVTPSERGAWTALVDWPPAADRPADFLLAGSKALRDTVTERLIGLQAQDACREDANLLYVAMTRARQYLFISGTESARSRDSGWYGMVRAAAADWETSAAGNPFIESGSPGTVRPAGDRRTGRRDRSPPGRARHAPARLSADRAQPYRAGGDLGGR
jgi:ATP-dependent helicase/nuclease subunit A